MALETTLQSTLGALVSGKCYPLSAPAGTVAPYITFRKIAGSPDLDLEGPGREHIQMQIDAFAKTYTEVKALEGLIKTAMTPIGLPLLFQETVDEATRLDWVIMEYSIWS